MSEAPTPAEEFDLQPHPRILPMLGEINLSEWRCLAEFVDNSIDAFLQASRAGSPVENPEVHISVPTVDDQRAKITVRDNAPGMEAATLENAMRAGWTGNDPLSNLGMFGMGFNIATARLGTVTRVWTTRQGDPEWCGLEIDFERLMQQRHFRTTRLSRPKVDPHEHGTEVTIERLKPDQRAWFSRPANHTKLARELGRVYSAMLRPNGTPISFRLMLKGNQVPGRSHCIWGGEGNPNRETQTSRYGVVNAYQPLDVRLPDRPFCVRCWQWLLAGEERCPACESAAGVVVRERRVYGWLGIQRYLSATDYGIDFLRHGRKIEIANRDLFYWSDGEVSEIEYPVDDPRNRGRIVGEIHLDHCRVTYTKDRFDRNDPAWDDMVRIVRGEGPVRPERAEDLGFGPDNSPLFLLFQAFRRSSPKPKVAGAYAKLLIVPDNDRAEAMAKRFYASEGEYQTDAKWWELVEEADRELLVPTTPAGGETEGLAGFGEETAQRAEAEPAAAAAVAEPPAVAPPPALPRVSIPSLSMEYRDDETNLRWDVSAFQVDAADSELGGSKPWALRTTAAGVSNFFVDTRHPIFQSATMTPLDALLSELAWSAMDFQRGNAARTTFAGVLANLRTRYAGAMKLDPVELSSEAMLTLSAIARSLSKHLGTDDSLALFDELSPAEQEAIQQRMATRSVRNPQQLISQGRFLEFAPRKTLLRFFERHPEQFFDGLYWDTLYSTLDYGRPAATEEAQAQVLRYFASLLSDAVWLAEQDPEDLAGASRARLLRAALALELLAPSSGEDEGP
jgi:hypothetical protein